MDLQLPVQSVPITTKVVSSNPVHGKVYLIQYYVMKVCQLLVRGQWFSLCTPVSYANKTESHLTEILLKVAISIINQTKLSQINKKKSQQLLDLQPSVAFYLDEERP